MIINITKSVLFTQDPDMRFSEEYGVPRGFWNLIFNRAKYLEYSLSELCELYQIKTGRKMDMMAMLRWVRRAEIYNKAQPLIRKGTRVVMSEYFGELEEIIVKELLKNVRRSDSKGSRTII